MKLLLDTHIFLWVNAVDPRLVMLVAQALSEPLRLITADRKLEPYSDLVIVV